MSAELAVLVGFLLFCAILVYFGVPSMVTGLLDKRAAGIKTQLDEARKTREQAQKLLASFERKSEEMKREAGTIVERAKEDSKRAAEQAKLDLQESISRKLKAAEDRISQVEAAATREVRNAAASAAVTAATEVLGQKIDGSKGDALIDDGIALVASQLH